jgi:hypothetical protein
MKRIFCILTIFAVAASAEAGRNSFFDSSEGKELAPSSIIVQGEVEQAGPVNLESLPLRSVPVKEVSLENGKQVFKGAFFVTGYSLYDILDGKKVKKATSAFSPPLDLYVIVENPKGDKAVFSWGELFYRNSFDILISKTVKAINPSKLAIKWPLPQEPRIYCAGDLLNVRYISNPSKITVKSYQGTFPTEKPKDIYSPAFEIVSKDASSSIGDIPPDVEKRSLRTVSYGHGSGYKGVPNVSGFTLKDLLKAKVDVAEMGGTFVVISARDAYRVVFSANEILNRNDNQELLLVDRNGSSSDGRYLLFVAGDFFADRDVKAVEKIRIIRLD